MTIKKNSIISYEINGVEWKNQRVERIEKFTAGEGEEVDECSKKDRNVIISTQYHYIETKHVKTVQ